MRKFEIKSISFRTILDTIKYIILLAAPFILMDIFIRLFARGVKYNLKVIAFPSIFFSIIWIAFIIGVSLCLKRKAGRIFYGICFFLFFILFMTHAVYYPYTGFFFGFNLLQSAEEGSAYILDTLKKAGIIAYIKCLLVLISGISALVFFPKKRDKNNWTALLITFVIFLLFKFVTPSFLGKPNKKLEWDTWRNPRNVYQAFSDGNKNIKICGFYEYSFRDFHRTFLKFDKKQNEAEISFLDKVFSHKTTHKKNDYTGIFKGKNVIFLQLEGIDSWLFNEIDMPNFYGMRESSIIFNNHFSYYTGGGSTFNSELAVSTGFITPISFTQNAYSFNKNLYPSSLPNQFKKHGYNVNAFHMNSGEYYMREMNYLNWGYDNYYSLIDDGNYRDNSYQLDRELIENEFFYEKLFEQKEPFVHYIISYTPHTPFSLDSKMAKLLVQKVYGEEYGENFEVPVMTEEQVARFFATETDRMIGLLLQALKDNGLYENTVIVAFADHYLYTLNDKTILDQYKTTENNLINRTPFVIWSDGLRKTINSKVNSQIDILPTMLNMMGIDFYDEHYIGRDVFEKSYPGYVFFSDYSWFDGVNYVDYKETDENNSELSSNIPVADPAYIKKTNDIINNLIRKNDLTLKYDYFRVLKNNNSKK